MNDSFDTSGRCLGLISIWSSIRSLANACEKNILGDFKPLNESQLSREITLRSCMQGYIGLKKLR